MGYAGRAVPRTETDVGQFRRAYGVPTRMPVCERRDEEGSMPNISIISEKRRCTVCIHPERAAIDRLLASGGASQRAIADRFQVGRNALARHHERHVLQAVRNQIARRQEREANSLAEVWSERLEETFAAARRGLARAEDDDERWTNAIGFLSAMNKSCELGLKSAGVIEGGRGTTNVSIEQVIMLPEQVLRRPRTTRLT